MEKSCKISEIFESIQGEGLYIGEKHLFVRLFGCNLKCGYCDTNDIDEKKVVTLNKQSLFEEIIKSDAKIVSFTGGEPLLQAAFLANFLSEYKYPMKKRIYLETNGSLPYSLRNVINFVDIIAMDIKIESATGVKNDFSINDEFLLVARDREVFAKVVYDENITDKEIFEIANLGLKHGIEIVLQPKMPMNSAFDPMEAFSKLFSKYRKIRLIPQMHKFLNLP